MSYIGEDRDNHDLAANYGWTKDPNTKKRTLFTKGTCNIWSIRDGWQCADLIPFNGDNNDLRFQNHRPYMFLDDALINEA